jgi:NUMOD3 motif
MRWTEEQLRAHQARCASSTRPQAGNGRVIAANAKSADAPTKGKRWTKEQDDILVSIYPDNGSECVAKATGKTKKAVINRACILGVKSKKSGDHFDEWQKRAAASKVGKPLSCEHKQKISTANKGQVRAEESKQKMSMASKLRIERNGHPRGFLGMKHSDEAKAVISSKSKAAAARMTDDDILARTKKANDTAHKNGTVHGRGRAGASTWKAGWFEIGGTLKYYRSRWESNYAHYLEWLKSCGHVQSWRHEPVTFWFDGIKRGTVSYLPDFEVIMPDGSVEYHEVKGWMDAASATKIKRMAIYHPGVKLIVVDGKAYKSLAKTASLVVAGWEAPPIPPSHAKEMRANKAVEPGVNRLGRPRRIKS